MNSIEIVIFLILLLMVVPDVCAKIGRPAMANAFFVLFGLAVQNFLTGDVKAMLTQAGQVGFLLVLFEVGLEIELPRFRLLLRPLGYSLGWVLIQYPIVLGLATVAGLELSAALLAAAAMTGCSLSMAYYGWKNYPGLPGESRDYVLRIMVVLEMLAVVVLAVGSITLKEGFGPHIGWTLGGMLVMIILISRFATRLVRAFQQVIEETTHWKVHILVLLVLVICAAGERLGLAAAKTAFFLGLFMSRARYHGVHIEEHIAPISRRFLIPIFFVSLGLMIDGTMFVSQMALLAFAGAMILIGFRDFVHHRWLKTGGDRNAFLLFCPNLTMVALATTSLLEAKQIEAATWTMLTGLFLSVAALALLPRVNESAQQGIKAQREL